MTDGPKANVTSSSTLRPSNRLQRFFQRLSVVVGGVFVLTSLVADGTTIPTPQSFGATQVLLFLSGAALLTAGLLGRHAVGAYRATAVIMLSALFLGLAVELGATVVLALLPARPTPAKLPRAASLSYYASRGWGASYWAEHRRFLDLRKRYHDYSLWRSAHVTGRYLNTTPEGLRTTPGGGCRTEGPLVLVLGGSTVWGWGAPDSMTIPAYLSAELRRRGQAACVMNLGQNGFVSSQEVIELLGVLRGGLAPEVVIFLDGFNDVHAAFETGVAG